MGRSIMITGEIEHQRWIYTGSNQRKREVNHLGTVNGMQFGELFSIVTQQKTISCPFQYEGMIFKNPSSEKKLTIGGLPI